MEHLDRMTSSGCKTYLLLLKEFSKYEESFDPALVRIMLARAERRYIHYLAIVAYDSGVYKHSIERITIAPPLDVAIIWHAHMVNPSRYYEDVIRFHQSHLPKAFVPAESSALETDKLFNTHFPLHAMFSKDGTFVKGQTSVRAWEEMFDGVDEPYHLTPGNVSQGTTTVECCFCGGRLCGVEV
ncbi:hypothetical protein BX666DRAFT_815417 [Dichotomocladium elegans]|nr:hypothetical protein BX666DRAFT_815417 [Dichotomocladium elegans]